MAKGGPSAKSDNVLILDSGAPYHIVNDDSQLQDAAEGTSVFVHTATKDNLIGNIWGMIKMQWGGERRRRHDVIMQEMLYVPGLSRNFICCRK